ncbi:MAG: hypothetical protein J5374_04675 [Bacteroidales bacterium]|nr:hypothetical protein [Bacteroidales bacterium]
MKKSLLFLLTAAAVLAAGTILAIRCTTSGSKAGPCDIYERGGTPCVTAHSTTRILYSRYRGPLYQVQRDSDGATLDIRARDGRADAALQDAFCAGTVCRITVIYDQSGKGNDLLPAPPGTFQGPDKGGFNNPALADMAPALLDGSKVYGVYIMPGMGYRCNNARGLAVDDEPEGMYYVIDGTHYDSGCCFDYGNSSTNGRAVGTGTMETTYFGTSTAWGRGNGEGPWIMSDMEAGLFSGYGAKQNDVPTIDGWRFVSVFVNGGGGNRWDLRGADATQPEVTTFYSGVRPGTPDSDAYFPMHKKGGMLLGNGGDNGNGSAGTFYEGVMTVGYPSDETIAAVQANIAEANYTAYPLELSRITSFRPGESRQVGVFVDNTTGKTMTGLALEPELPDGWTVRSESDRVDRLEPGERITAIYTLTAPEGRSSGEFRITARSQAGPMSISTRIRCSEALKINEIGLTTPFVELYNADEAEADLSGLEVYIRRSGWAPVKALAFPEGTRLAAGAHLLLEVDPAAPAAPATTVFIPVSTGPRLSFHAGSTNLPATSVAGFAVGEKMGIDLGGRYEEVTVTAVGSPATQSSLSAAAKAGDTQLLIEATAALPPGSQLTVDTGDRIETVTVKTLVRASEAPVRGFGRQQAPHEPGIVELERPLKGDHAVGVDVSCPGGGISFTPATRFAHASGDALQPLGSGWKPTEGMYLSYAPSATAGSVALVDPATGTVLDAVVYGSQQSNSSANGTIASPALAVLEGDQRGGGCIAVAPGAVSPFMLARNPGLTDVRRSLVRMPDGADTDVLSEDFRISEEPTPGYPNTGE